MHILYLHQYFVPPGESGGIRSYEMAKRLVRDGFSVDLVTSSAFFGKYTDLSSGWNKINMDGINVHVLRLPYSNKMGFLKRILVFLYFAIRCCLYVLRFKPHIVFATSTPLTIAIPAIIISKVRSVPFIFEVRDLWPEVPIEIGAIKNRFLIFLSRALEAFSYRCADRIIALSPGIERGIRSILEKDIFVIPNASDIDFFSSVEKDPESVYRRYPFLGSRPYLVYAGTLGAVNNIDYLIDLAVMSKANGSPFNVVIFGDGREKSRIASKSKACGVLCETFYLCDPVPKIFLASILGCSLASLSTVIPCPAMFNNSANKFFDALAIGKPIVINHGGWLSELITEKRCGLVLSDELTYEDFRGLCRLSLDSQYYNELSENAFNLARDRFEREKLYLLFRSVLSPEDTF